MHYNVLIHLARSVTGSPDTSGSSSRPRWSRALGLPSAAQAQTPAAPMVTGTGDGVAAYEATITATWGRLSLGTEPTDQDQWLVEYTEPGVAWDEATEVPIDGTGSTIVRYSVLSPRMTPGSIMVSGDFACPTMDADLGPLPTTIDWTVRCHRHGRASITDYQHGPPSAAPTGFDAHPAGPDARRLVWDERDGAGTMTRGIPPTPADDEAEWDRLDDPAMSGMLVD